MKNIYFRVKLPLHLLPLENYSLFNENDNDEIVIPISFEKTMVLESEWMRCLGDFNGRLRQLGPDSPFQPLPWRPARRALFQTRIAVVVDFLPKYF